MEIVFFIIGCLIVLTYIYTSYRISKSKERISAWKLLLITFIPFWGCFIYLVSTNQTRVRNSSI